MRRQVDTQGSEAGVGAFLRDVGASGFAGDVETSMAARVVRSTDNSIWQKIPQAVLCPRTHDDVVQILAVLSKDEHRDVSIAPRGGGTSTAGQSLNSCVVVDLARRMHHIEEINAEEKIVVVQSGVILSALNDALRPHGLMFGPTVSTADRATIGGMIANDSAGMGSLRFGKTSDAVVELVTVLPGGETITTRSTQEPIPNDHLSKAVRGAVEAASPHFEQEWPKLQRFPTGYNLPMAWDGHFLDLNRIICGAEGTLGIVTQATLQCVDIPEPGPLLLCCFDSIDAALAFGKSLAPLRPRAVEVVDELVLEVARSDAGWHDIAPLLDDAVSALLVVELDNDGCGMPRTAPGLLGIHQCSSDSEREHAWNFRRRAVGLLSAAPGNRRPVPFVEDCGVPPDHLPDFISDFRGLLDRHELRCGMFGHVDAGVIHVRPRLDLRQPSDRNLVQVVADEVTTLVQAHGGILWGEHGKGFRSGYGPAIFGAEIWAQMCVVKAAFDPKNQMNPGKVAPPSPEIALTPITTSMRGERDAAIDEGWAEIMHPAIACDGNSQCRSADRDAAMCPTFRAGNDPIHSPRGRAELLRHWMQDVGSFPQQSAPFLRRLWNTLVQGDDFAHQMRASLDGCLGCRACATACPLHVDIARFRSDFYAWYYGQYLRPLRDLATGHMEHPPPGATLFAPLLGLVDLPVPETSTSNRQSIVDVLQARPDVAIVPDPFTAHYRPQVIAAMQRVVERMGMTAAVLPVMESGKPLHVRGFTEAFSRVVSKNIESLRPLVDTGIPLVGIDPATTLLWRDEYKRVHADAATIEVLLPQEWLRAQGRSLRACCAPRGLRLMPHCIERATAPQAVDAWTAVFEQAGGDLSIVDTACCGMGGMFGHEREHAVQSLAIWRNTWGAHEVGDDTLATGFSCHEQAKRAIGRSLRHPLEVLV